MAFIPPGKSPCPADRLTILLVHSFVHQFLRRRCLAIKLIPQDIPIPRQITDPVQQVAPAVYPPGAAYQRHDFLFHNRDMFLHIHTVQMVAVQSGYNTRQQDAKMLPFCIVFLVWDRFRLRHGLQPGHCFFQSRIKVFFQFQAERKFFLIVCVFHFQRFQGRRKHAHIFSEKMFQQVPGSRWSGFGNFVIYHLLQPFLIDSRLSHTVRPKHLSENFYLTLSIGGNLFFHFRGRYRRAFFRAGNFDFIDSFLVFFHGFFHSIERLLLCLLCLFHNLVYIEHF